MFVDVAKIYIKSGNGGNGAVSFRREKYAPLGGPDGGDGGDGGNVVFAVDQSMRTLLDFKYKRKHLAENGDNGGTTNCYGKKGADMIIKVPKGTVLKEAVSGKIVVDLVADGQKAIICKGGRGGRGNAKFATPTRQAPEFAEPGMPGEEIEVILELKLIADVGLIGFPNVGKSTILSMVTGAKPKIANYHFTTLTPNLGVAEVKGVNSFVIADIPGLIEGAHEGIGLGIDFLRHVERTKVLIHVIDVSGIEGRDPVDDFYKINEELKQYSEKLSTKPQIVAANKTDIPGYEENLEKLQAEMNKLGMKLFVISAATNSGLRELFLHTATVLSNLPEEDDEDVEFFIPEDKHFAYEFYRDPDGAYCYRGTFVDRLLLSTNIYDPDSLKHFHKMLTKHGILDDLRSKGIQNGDLVRMNDFEFDFVE
jgi:GTPase